MPTLVIDGIIGWDVTTNYVREFLNKNENKDITVEISSPGGSVFQGMPIFNMIKNHKGNVTTHIMGLAASMASIIALAGNRVVVEENSVFMIHNASLIAGGDHKQLRKMADFAENTTKLLSLNYAKKTNKDISQIIKMMDDETWFFGDEILEAGFADEMIKNNIGDDVNNTKENRIIFAQSRFDNCLKTMKKSDRSKNDINEIAALLESYDLNNDHNTESNNTGNVEKNEVIKDDIVDNIKNTGGKKNMDKNELKAKYPELYNEIYNLGGNDSKKELENIQAHLVFAKIAPELVMENIKNKVEFSVVSSAKYQEVQMMVKMKIDRAGDNPEDINPKPPEDNAINDKDTQDYTNLLAQNMRGIN